MSAVYSFYFIRHAFSCANLSKKKATTSSHFALVRKIKYTYYQLQKDPHLANWGILSVAKLRKEYDRLFYSKKINNMFCSQLIRTWETAYLLFGSDNIEKFKIAPYVKEGAPGPSNNAYLYKKNTERFYDFVEYSTKVSTTLKIIKNEVKPLKTRYSKLFDKYDLSIDHKFKLPEYSGDINKKYSGIYNKADLSAFIIWYINNFKNQPSAICVSHGIAIRGLLKKLMPERFKNNVDHENSYNMRKYNAYCYEVKIRGSINNKSDLLNNVVSIRLANNGVQIPEKGHINNLRFACNGLCEISDSGCKLYKEENNIETMGEMINSL